MKKQLFALLVFCFIAVASSNAQFKTAPDGITFKRVLMDFYSIPNNKLADFGDLWETGGAEIGYNRHLSEIFNLAIPARIGSARLVDANGNFTGNAVLNSSLDATIQLKYFKPKKFIAPYLLAGIGVAAENWANPRIDIPFGLGVNFRLAPLLYLNLQAEYRKSLKENRDNMAWSGGLLLLLGSEINDRDKDEVADEVDACPDTPGLAQFNGCPDADADGVPEPGDACPGVAGLVALQGCPDMDGDGVADDKDKCIDVPGLAQFDGCPDADEDGVPEPGDACPGVKGTVALNGCPDKDGDGIMDSEDACPTQKGTKANKGCPDRDNDGVIDSEDKCPDQAGPASNKGCPEMKVEEKAKLDNVGKSIQFEYGSAIIKKTSYPIIDEVVNLMKTYPAYSCDINVMSCFRMRFFYLN